MDESNDARARVMRLAGRDPWLAHLGVTCLDGGPGRAAVALTLREEHINFNGTCHGGVVFTLADTAFGLAGNSHGLIAAGIDAHITYQLAARIGDTVTATAVEVSRSRRIAVYRVDVTRGDGALLSVFTGTVYITTRHNDELPPDG
jgi:acyl-CoA thioesterase